jgi:hypothetical protein
MKSKTHFLICFLVFLATNSINAQSSNIQKKTKIYLSAHAPMWSANIDLKKNTFFMMSNEGAEIIKKVKVIYNKKKKNTLVIKSTDDALIIIFFKNKNNDCPYDIPENKASNWHAKMVLDKQIFYGCAYFEL